MRLLLVLGIFCLPIVDLLLSAQVAAWMGLSVWWLIAVGVGAGLWVLTNERSRFRAKTLAALHHSSLQGSDRLMGSLFHSGRRLLAGLLLLIPGILSDGIAFILLLMPLKSAMPVAANSVINGQFKRLD